MELIHMIIVLSPRVARRKVPKINFQNYTVRSNNIRDFTQKKS